MVIISDYTSVLNDIFKPNNIRSSLPNIPHEAEIKILPRKTCKKQYYNRFTSRMLCAGFQNGGRDTCDGDSGGPLMCKGKDGRWKLTGITSWGDNSLCDPNSDKPGVYVNVLKYLKWIKKRTSGLDNGTTLGGDINWINEIM